MDINELARQCHQVARDKGFYNYGQGGTDAHMWKQVTHIFIELVELEIAHSDSQPYKEEAADVAIVLMDLCAWLGIQFEGYTEYEFKPSFMPMRGARAATGHFADLLRKEGTADLIKLSLWASITIAYLVMLVPDLEESILAKLEKNKARPYQYGISTAEPKIPK